MRAGVAGKITFQHRPELFCISLSEEANLLKAVYITGGWLTSLCVLLYTTSVELFKKEAS